MSGQVKFFLKIQVVTTVWILVLIPFLAQAKLFEGVPADRIEDLYFKTAEGITLKLIHIKNPGKPIVIMNPGMGVRGLSLARPAAQLWQGGYDVVITNWRGSEKLRPGDQRLGKTNGLEQITRVDYPEQLRYVIRDIAAPEQLAMGLSLFGHSMGGMMIAATLSDPQLAAELGPYIRGIALFQSPHHAAYMSSALRAVARVGIPVLEKLKSLGVEAIDMHSRLLHMGRKAKLRGGFNGRVLTPLLENLAHLLAGAALNPVHTGRSTFREAMLNMPAYEIPIDLTLGFARAVLREDGAFLDASGRPLIVPDALRRYPVSFFRARLDNLAPWKEQQEYHDAVGARSQLVNIEDMSHISPVLIDRLEADFMHHLIRFYAEPRAEIARHPVVDFSPTCETLLSRLARFGRRVRFGAIGY